MTEQANEASNNNLITYTFNQRIAQPRTVMIRLMNNAQWSDGLTITLHDDSMTVEVRNTDGLEFAARLRDALEKAIDAAQAGAK